MTGTKLSENVGSGNTVSAVIILSIYFKKHLNCELNITKGNTVLYFQESIFLLGLFSCILLLNFACLCSLFFSPVNIH